MSSRDRFESAMIKTYGEAIDLRKNADSQYVNGQIRYMYAGWIECEASREFVVELPASENLTLYVGGIAVRRSVIDTSKVKAAIEAAGGRVI
jgi:hypothetical protein